MDPVTGALQTGGKNSDDRAFAISAGDVNHRRQAVLGIAQAMKQCHHPVEGQIYKLRMQPGKALQDCVATRQNGPSPRPARRTRL